jgi:hypothetical protein
LLGTRVRRVPLYILGRTAAQSKSPLPAGWRLLLLQGLVTKSEYNGKRACVRFFDDQAGRYTVKLDDDGKRLRLKPEFVVPDETEESWLAVVAEGEAKMQEQKTLVDTLRAQIAAKKSDLSALRNDSKGKVSRATRLSHAAR